MTTIGEALAIALQHHQAGRLAAAEQIYRQVLNVDPNHVDALHLLGVMANQVGQYAAAIELLERANQVMPGFADAYNNLAYALVELGRIDEAIACYRRAVDLNPNYVDALVNLGNVLLKRGDVEEAIDCYRRALALKPDDAIVHRRLGGALNEQKRFDEAIACFRRAVELRPDLVESLNELGVALGRRGRYAEAAECYRRALAIRPDSAEVYSNLGNALKNQDNLKDAIACHQRAVALKPDFAEAHFNLGCALRNHGQLDEAIASFRQALALKLDHAMVHNDLGVALRERGQIDDAIVSLRRAVELDPNFAEARNNLGIAVRDLGRLDEAIDHLQRGIALDPQCAEIHVNLAMSWLLAGDLQRGWPEYEWRWRTKIMPRPASHQPLWDGSPLAGRTILLLAEQGFGDSLQFIRFAAMIKERGGNVALECPEALVGIMKTCSAIETIVPAGQPRPRYDVCAPLMSLPGLLGIDSPDRIPATIPYLFANAERVSWWKQEFDRDREFKIGIVWQGNPRVSRPDCRALDRRRSIDLSFFEPLARTPGVRLYSLQKGFGSEQLAEWGPRWNVVDLSSRLDDWTDTAAVMTNLDLIVSADTAPAHLAAALGRPTWLALPSAVCWRWLQSREDTPWYPTMRLFRQETFGDWGGVFERMAGALAVLTKRSLSS